MKIARKGNQPVDRQFRCELIGTECRQVPGLLRVPIGVARGSCLFPFLQEFQKSLLSDLRYLRNLSARFEASGQTDSAVL